MQQVCVSAAVCIYERCDSQMSIRSSCLSSSDDTLPFHCHVAGYELSSCVIHSHAELHKASPGFCCLLSRFPKTDSALLASNSKAKKSYDLHASLWDATMVAVQQELRQDKNRRRELVQAADAIRAAFVKLCGDSDFKTSLENRSKRNVMKRIQLMRQLLQTAAPCRR